MSAFTEFVDFDIRIKTEVDEMAETLLATTAPLLDEMAHCLANGIDECFEKHRVRAVSTAIRDTKLQIARELYDEAREYRILLENNRYRTREGG